MKKKTSQGGEHFIVKVPLKSIHKRTRMQGVIRVVPQLVSITWWVAIQKNKHNLRTEETKKIYTKTLYEILGFHSVVNSIDVLLIYKLKFTCGML